MSLPDLAAVKAYLRVDGTAEDTVLASILLSATAMVQRFVERPLVLAPRTFVDCAYTARVYGTVDTLLLPQWPIHPGDILADPPIPAPVITDGDGEVVAAALYTVQSSAGIFRSVYDASFPDGPYVIVAQVGLAAYPNYADEIEPVLAQCILDTCSDLYSNRTPSAQSETAGGGVSVSWRGDDGCGLPPRARTMLLAYKPVGVA
ncbi:MAG: head-tail connector protein [bacterium]